MTQKQKVMNKDVIVTLEIEGRKCMRCLGTWIKRGKKEPKQCPKCHSPYWMTALPLKTKRTRMTS